MYLFHNVLHSTGDKKIYTEIREVKVPVVLQNKCNAGYRSKKFKPELPKGITENLLCAGAPEGGKSPCQVNKILN